MSKWDNNHWGTGASDPYWSSPSSQYDPWGASNLSRLDQWNTNPANAVTPSDPHWGAFNSKWASPEISQWPPKSNEIEKAKSYGHVKDTVTLVTKESTIEKVVEKDAPITADTLLDASGESDNDSVEYEMVSIDNEEACVGKDKAANGQEGKCLII